MITVIVPTYNRGHIACRTIPKYLGDPRVSSIVVVDDGSSDETGKVIAAMDGGARDIVAVRKAFLAKQFLGPRDVMLGRKVLGGTR